MKLNFQMFPEHQTLADPALATPLIVIPGLFGSIANWRHIARQLGETIPTIIIDQRNHGRSPHADSHSYADMVADLQLFCDDHGLQKVHLCGHSMGGKVAMLFTLEHPDRVRQLIVMDIAPLKYHHSHAPFLEQLMQIDLTKLTSRKDADRKLQAAIADDATRLFLLQSLSGSADGYSWRLNLPVLHDYMEQITGFPEVNTSANNEALFVAGALSDYLLAKHHPGILELFPNARFHMVAGAGHWLHAEQPKKVLETIQEFIKDDRK